MMPGGAMAGAGGGAMMERMQKNMKGMMGGGPSGGGMAGMPGMKGGMPGMMDASASGLSAQWANDLFGERSWDFGTVRRGENPIHSFRLTNDLTQPVRIKDVRVSAGFIKANAPLKQLAPGTSATIDVQMDTRRFSGDKTSSIYVVFDQPAHATVQLQLQADSRDITVFGETSMPPDTKAQKDAQTKITELEKKVDRLIQQMDALRELSKQGKIRE
jgi:hypothetical protein